ncbi:hypothetical protein FRC01_005145, partial [Tulasnella sp. 417]
MDAISLGGYGTTAPGERKPLLDDFWKFEIRTETWTKVQGNGLPLQPRVTHTATVVGDNMFVFGGTVPGPKVDKDALTDHALVYNFRDYTWQSLAMSGLSPAPTREGVLLTLDSHLILVGGQASKQQRINFAEIRAAGHLPDGFAKLQFTTETNKLKFTTEVVDLSRFVRKQGNSAHSLAGFSDVWKGEMTETGQPIAIKILRVARTGNIDDPESGRLRTRFDRELTIWMECQHPRVLELLGYAYIEGIPCLISPWCSNGNIMEYLSKHPNADKRRLANVLVSDERDAKLCDFGISKLVSEHPSGFTTTASVKGTLRYSSPEMLDGQSTMKSDVWAFGMLILHVMTDKIPYAELLSDAKVIMAIMGGQRPLPENYAGLSPTDPLWDIMRECWDEDPMKRPIMSEVLGK